MKLFVKWMDGALDGAQIVLMDGVCFVMEGCLG